MKEKQLFSVIIPTYNRCYVLWRAVQSVLSQTYPYFELFVVDDGSGDDTQKLISQFSDPRICYIRLGKNAGATAARNVALRKSRGEYIAYLDSDNRWSDDYLEVMKNGFANNPNKVLLFCKKNYRLRLLDERGGEVMLRDEFSNSRKFFDLKRLWQRKIMIDTSAMCHKRREIVDLGGWDESIDFWEDWELTLRVSEKYPDGFLYLNRTMLDYEQVIDVANADGVFKKWEKAERQIFGKYCDHELLKDQSWFPPRPGNKSTLGVIEFLREKKKALKK